MKYYYRFMRFQGHDQHSPGVLNGGMLGGPTSKYYYTSAEQQVAALSGVAEEWGSNGPWVPAIIKHNGSTLSAEKSSATLELQVARDFAIAALWRTGPPAGTVWLNIYADDEGGALFSFGSFRVREVVFTESGATIRCLSLLDVLQRPLLTRKFARQCSLPLYGGVASYSVGSCGLNKMKWRVASTADDMLVYGALSTADGQITAISDDGLTLTAPIFANKPDGWLAQGFIEFDSRYTGAGGAVFYADRRRSILSHTGTTIELMHAVDGLAVGDYFIAYKGCDHSFDGSSGCASFNNKSRCGAFPYIPIRDPFQNGLV